MTKTGLYGLLLLIAFAVACVAANPFLNVPIIDDWLYLWSVEQMHDSGRFRILDYSCHYHLLHVLWGAAFCVRGCSFNAVRASTAILGAAGVLAFYAALARRTSRPALAGLTAATLAFNPVFFVLALSFMTDVPLVALVAIAFWLFARGVAGERYRLAAVAAALGVGVAAYLVRELAIGIPSAMLVVALLAAPDARARRRLVGLGGLVGIGFGVELWWIGTVQGVSTGLSQRAQGVGQLLEVPMSVYARSFVHLCLTAAALVAPLSLSTLRRGDGLRVLAVAAVCAAAGVALGAVPFGANEVLSPLGLGMTRVLMPGMPVIDALGQTLRAAVLGAAALSLAVILCELAAQARSEWRALSAIDWAWALFGTVQVGLLMLLWLWQDRYYLIIVPPLLWLLALRAHRVGWQPLIAIAGCALFAVIAVAGTRDNFALNQAAWDAEAWLRSTGVAAEAIDGGYALNGWRLYAHPERYAPGFPPERVPFLYSRDRLPYVVSVTPLSDAEVLREVTWTRSWIAPAHVYALRAHGAG